MHKQKGFTLSEMLISVVLLSLVATGFFASFHYSHRTGIAATKKAMTLNNMRSALDKFKHDILISKGLYYNDYTTVYNVSSSFATHSTDTNQLIIKVPSIDSSGEFINLYDSNYTDYYRYYVSNGNLIRKTYKSNEANSARSTNDYILARGIQSVKFGNGLNYLGDTETSSDDIHSMRHVQITVKARIKNTVDGTYETVELILNVSFRNYF